MPVADLAGRAGGVHEGGAAGRDRDGHELDRLRDPPRARTDDGGVADGGDGQAQLQAAHRSADRGVGGAGRVDRPGALARLRQHHPGQGVPRRRAGDDRRQQRGGPALDAGALPVPRRGRRLSAGRRGRRRCDLAGRGAHAHLRPAQDLHRLDPDHRRASAPSSGSTRPATSAATSCPVRTARTGSGCASSNCAGTRAQPETAAYVCESCEQPIAEHHKTWMLEHGEWRAHGPGERQPRPRAFTCHRCTARSAGAAGATLPPRGRARSARSLDRQRPSRPSRTPNSARPGSRKAKRRTGSACSSAARTTASAPCPSVACCWWAVPTCRRIASRSRSGPSGVARSPGWSSTAC